MSEKALTLSIVIPVYNEQRYLPDCLDSIARQSELPDEVIVVDNNSTDKTLEIAKSYSFVKVLYEKKQGIVFARNAGFDGANSDLIGRIDADTILEQDWVSAAKIFFKDNPQAASVTGACYFYDFPLKHIFHSLHSFVYYVLQRFIAGTHILWGSNMAIRKNAWQKIKPETHMSSGIHEDIDLSLCLHSQRQNIGYSHDMLAEVSLRRGNLTTHGLNKYLAAWHKTYFVNGIYIRTIFILVLEAITILSAILFMPFRKLVKKSFTD